MGKSELDMQQYKNVFGTCRIPGMPGDSMEYHRDSKHIIVVANDVFFKVPVYDVNNEPLCENQLFEQIQICLNEAAKVKNPLKIGVLTSDNRDIWAKAYLELTKSDQNKISLRDIQQSLFLMCIDRDIPQIEDDTVTAEHLFVTGAGSRMNSGNRWYDKTIQFIVGTRGINGLTYEHSPAEGGPLAVLTDNIIKYVNDQEVGKVRASSSSSQFSKPTRLDFQSSPQIEEMIKVSSDNIDKLANNIEMGYLHFTDYGKNFIKSQKFSPDSYIQMAIQFAFYRLHHVPGAHYESAGTRLYVHGRTECIRSCSKESIAFARAMLESKDDKEKLQKMKAAIDAHKKYVSQAVQGFGIDRHLLGLKLIAKENGIEVPALYSDEGYIKSSTYRLSTSQVASAYDAFMCYGPLTNDGYACCYSPRNNDIWFGLSSMRENNETSTAKFRKSMEEALRAMQHVLINVGEQPVKSKL
jgi:carnitine O-acetyltransferase